MSPTQFLLSQNPQMPLGITTLSGRGEHSREEVAVEWGNGLN